MENNKIFRHQREFIFIKATSERITIHKVLCDDIVAFEAKNNYIKLHLIGSSFMSYIGISEIENLFSDDPRFLRLHRSFIVSVKHIDFIRNNQITLTSGIYFTVGEMYEGILRKFVAKHLIKNNKSM